MLDSLKSAILRRRQSEEQSQAVEYAKLVASAVAGELDDGDADVVDAVLARCAIPFHQFEADCRRRCEVAALEVQAAGAEELAATVRDLKAKRSKLDADFAKAKQRYEAGCRECDAALASTRAQLATANTAREKLRREHADDSAIGRAAVQEHRRGGVASRLETLRHELSIAERDARHGAETLERAERSAPKGAEGDSGVARATEALHARQARRDDLLAEIRRLEGDLSGAEEQNVAMQTA